MTVTVTCGQPLNSGLVSDELIDSVCKLLSSCGVMNTCGNRFYAACHLSQGKIKKLCVLIRKIGSLLKFSLMKVISRSKVQLEPRL
jgi:hypothetical protein